MTTAEVRARDIASCPLIPCDRVGQVAYLGQVDAVELASDIREVDPREVWGRLARWARENPNRLYAAVVALAAMVPIEEPVSRLLAWTDHLEVAS